jgi:hypothetical protein
VSLLVQDDGIDLAHVVLGRRERDNGTEVLALEVIDRVRDIGCEILVICSTVRAPTRPPRTRITIAKFFDGDSRPTAILGVKGDQAVRGLINALENASTVLANMTRDARGT